VVVIAVVAFAVAGALGAGVAEKLGPYGADDPSSESVRAAERLERAGLREVSIVVLFPDADAAAQSTERRVGAVRQRLERDPDVGSVGGFGTARDRDFVARDGTGVFIVVALKATGGREIQDAAERIADELAGTPGAVVGGPAIVQVRGNKQVESDLRRAELLAFPLLFLFALLFFRGVVAALLPLLVGALAIVGTYLIISLASELTDISVFALNLATGLGLGLAIDYSLFIVSRYREEIAKDGPGLPAMRRTLATAGRTVLFSSLTVATALASLLVFPQQFLYSLGLGGSLVALLAAAVALVVLPAVLTLLGERVNALAPSFLRRRADADARPAASGFWYRLARFAQRSPGRIALAGSILMLVLGLPFWGIEFTSSDKNARILPAHHSGRQVDDVLRAEFVPFLDAPIDIVVSGARAGQLAELRGEVAALDGVGRTMPPQPVGDGVTLLRAFATVPFISRAGRDTVESIRAIEPPPGVRVEVAGASADFVDFQHSLGSHLPTAVALVVIATLIILFLMTGSVVLPVKALLLNVLNLSAVFGILVFVFQDGRLEGLLGYMSQGGIEQTLPVLLFAVAFGLSTDYAVFLLSRIKEARDHGASNSDAVAMGLERTGRIVTAAALLFAIAIGAFATSEIVFIKENGVGTALAVLLDASIIRALLVPALMELLGGWNWWAPRPLRRLHERIGLGRGHALAE
jgi:RND superfamily putative drug exporter